MCLAKRNDSPQIDIENVLIHYVHWISVSTQDLRLEQIHTISAFAQ